MLHVDAYELTRHWESLGSRRLRRVGRTGVSAGKLRLCNALEWVHWNDAPIQTTICEVCWHPECASGGYVNISRLGAMLLWTIPEIESPADWERLHFEPDLAVELNGSVVIPVSIWQQWQAEVPSLPAPELFPPATVASVANAWWMEAKAPARAPALDGVVDVLRPLLLASDSLSTANALHEVQTLVRWFQSDGEQPALGSLRRAADIGATVETLYFDGPAAADWPALAKVGGAYVPAFGREWVYVP